MSGMIRRLDCVLVLVCLVLFAAWPKIDIHVSGMFYQDQRFGLGNHAIIQLLYGFFAVLPVICFCTIGGALVFAAVRKQKVFTAQCITLLIFLVLVPGIVITNIIKDNSTGRARPRQIVTFGGDSEFTGPFQYSGVCSHNCSFVSGHAANGFFLMTPFWIFRRRRWLFIGVAAGGVAGLGRVVQGAHYFSDVIFAGWISYFLYFLLAKLIGKYCPGQVLTRSS